MGRNRECGASLIEVTIVAALAITIAALAVPLTAHTADVSKGRHAAGFLAGQLRIARHQAVSTNHGVAVLFDEAASGWSLRRCTDGNGNGVRRADVESGVDACAPGTVGIAQLFPGVRLTLGEGIPEVDGTTPDGDGSGVRFGRGRMASCAPLGGCSPGTLYLRTDGGHQFAVRVAGMTARTRILRYDPARSSWASE